MVPAFPGVRPLGSGELSKYDAILIRTALATAPLSVYKIYDPPLNLRSHPATTKYAGLAIYKPPTVTLPKSRCARSGATGADRLVHIIQCPAATKPIYCY